MALSIKSEAADHMARELAAVTGESITQAVTIAIQDRLRRERRSNLNIASRLRAVREEMRGLPILDDRSENEILGYDETGLPS
jgi:antitoxin VapB